MTYEHPFSAEYEKLKAICSALSRGVCNVSIDDGLEDDLPDIFTVNLDGIEDDEELETLELFEGAIKRTGLRVTAAEVSEQIGKAWLLVAVPFGEKITPEKEEAIRESIRINVGKSVEDIGGETGVYGSMTWIKIHGELFTQFHEPQADNLGDGVVWVSDFKSWNFGNGGIPITVKVAYFPVTEFLNSDDDGREFLVANAEQCDWERPVIV